MGMIDWEPITGEFNDEDGEVCAIYEGGRKSGTLYLGRRGALMKLDQTLAGELAALLKQFAETGRLR